MMAERTAGIKSTPRRQSETSPATTPEKTPETVPDLQAVIIECPLGAVGDAEYLSRHVESRLKTREQQLAMKRLLRGLQGSHATTRDGRPVQRYGEAVRWILEQIGGVNRKCLAKISGSD